MKKLILLFAFLFSLFCKSQTLLTKDEIKIQRFGKELLYKTLENKPLNGYYKIADERGNYTEMTLKKGKLEGKIIKYNYDDIKLSEENFKNGKLNGEYLYFYKNGKISKKGFYVDGKQDGKWEFFNDKGELEKEENYKLGKKDGRFWIKRYSSGTFYTKTEFYKDDNPIGEWVEKWQNGNLKETRSYKEKGTYVQKTYHNNGKLHEQKIYKNFKLDGLQLVYYPSTILRKRELYKDGVIEKEERYFDNSLPYKIYNYKNGKYHGKCTIYTESGNKSVEVFFVNGLKEGVAKEYFYKGTVQYETTYKNDVENGKFKRYFLNGGKVREEGNYLNGLKDGIWLYYDETGKLIEEVEYKNDNIIKETKHN